MPRITIVTHELRGFLPVGGMGTATTFLAVALARMGHSVEILLGVMHRPEDIDPEWDTLYKGAGIRIRPVPANDVAVVPEHFARTYGVARALQADPPDVVVVHDLGAPAYSALRLRQLGLALQDTLFVVFCHGTRRWVLDMSRRLHIADLEHVLALSVLERMSLELADVVVSPSAYLVGWMREQGWRLPERTLVIPYITRSAALGQPPPTRPSARAAAGVQRIAFFGRLEEKKGLKPFAAALNKLEPDLLERVELEFVGKPTATWPPDHVEQLLSEQTRRALRGVSFASDLDQAEALARLGRPGTLVVTPSLGDNSPNTVYECIEHGLALIASNVGGIPELVAPDDRARVLFEPTPDGIAEALRRALADPQALRPPRPAFDGADSYRRWAEVVETSPQPLAQNADGPVDVVVLQRGSREAVARCVAALERQTSSNARIHVAETRAAGLQAGTAPYVVFLDEDDVPDPELLDALLRAQAASGADVVSCGVRVETGRGEFTVQLFAGQPGGLGAIANGYGTVALLRRGAVEEETAWPAARDPDWPILAGCTAAGAQVVSIPAPLVTRRAEAGSVQDNPSEALLAVHALERGLPGPLRGTARLAAGLAANAPPARAPSAKGRVVSVVLRAAAAIRRLSGAPR